MPGYVSQPHFLNADEKFLDAVEGLVPNETHHDMIMQFEPVNAIAITYFEGNINNSLNL